jgi:predicted DNA-binding transcriptional regulator YafY
VRVRVWFDDKVARYVRRRMWHPTQRFKRTSGARGGIEMTMEVRGTVEVTSWVLGFGATAEVLEPPELRAAVRAELRAAEARYARRG